MSNIFDNLRKDHDVQRNLMEKILTTSGESERRAELFEQLKKHLDEHAKYEERFFYKPLMGKDSTQDMSRHGVAEHKDLDDLVDELEQIDMASPAWLRVAKKLNHKLLHHLEEEEREFFQQAGKVLSDRQKIKLGEQYLSSMSA